VSHKLPAIEWYGPSPPWAPAEVLAREREDAARRALLAPQPMGPEQIADLVARVRSARKSLVRSVLVHTTHPRRGALAPSCEDALDDLNDTTTRTARRAP
jgi:hypothetical protein